ncbi:MAG: LapD/MoxY N-terminal periplasmic domain-containing protein [Gammaproteobacteria bacterium]|nr:LapD/MoxY N-terminal periplasmic domain-containing protein [Gammaproteobacteria bacterium]
MTLFKQIAILVSLMLLLLAGIFIVNDFSRSAKFLQGQLATTAQDMTTTLGIAITNMPDGSDKASLEVLFNSVFDSGYYSNIELVGIDGSVIHQKSQEIEIEEVPEWFIQQVQLKPARGSTQVMQGWNMLGQLNINLHPGYVYSSLYAAFLTTLKWLVIIIVGTMVLLWLFLHYLFQPLQRVKEQADSIHNNQFVQQQKVPSTPELKSVVEAMNRMVAKVQSIFDDQENAIARYQHMLYHDNLSGLGNRRYMMDHIKQSLAEESSFHGCLGILKLVNFGHIRERLDYEVSDSLIKDLANLLCLDHSGYLAEKTARLSDDEFAFLLAADEDSVNKFILSLYKQFKQLPQLTGLAEEIYLVAGVSAVSSGRSMGDLLSGVDYCLTRALSGGPYTIEQKTMTDLELPQGKMQWRHWFEKVFSENKLFLVGQLALDQGKKPVQKEVFIRVRNDENQVIPASSFMPMASSLGLSIDIDKAVFELVNQNQELDPKIPLALNLSAAFFELADAREAFEKMLQQCAARGIQLCIEASHHVLLHHANMCHQVSEKVKQNGHQFGVDNLDLGLSLQLLQTTRFDYVKINASNLGDFSSEEVSSGFQALKKITDTLDIRIIVVGVDEQSQFNQLRDAGIEVMQGNLLGEPESI